MTREKGSIHRVISVTVLVLLLTTLSEGTLSRGSCSKRKKKDDEQAMKPKGETVHERGLVVEDVEYSDITKEHNTFSSQVVREFPGPVLGYVTPWNNHGYDIAKQFARKFTHISPVWLQIHRKPGGAYVMAGLQDIDKKWMEDVKNRARVQIVPRVLFDGWSMKDYEALFATEDSMEDCIDVIMKTLTDYKFDGFVIEIWSQLQGQKRGDLLHFIPHLGEAFREAHKTFILVIPPASNSERTHEWINFSDFEKLAPFVDFFNVMAYDYTTNGYSGSRGPGPNAPIGWIQDIIVALDEEKDYRQKILLGLNFYGVRFEKLRSEPIIGKTYIEELKKRKPKIIWEENTAEHRTESTTPTRQVIYFPSLKSIYTRLQFAEHFGTGIGIWEIGQGLDYFYDLL